MVVVVIIGILVAIAIPIYGTVTENAQNKAHEANIRTIKGAAQMYAMETDPPSVTIDGGNSQAISVLKNYLEDGLTPPRGTDVYTWSMSDGEVTVLPATLP